MNQPVIPWRESGLRWLWIAVAVIVLDQVSKLVIVSTMELDETIYVLPFFDLYRTFNTGAAWSMFANAGGAQRWVFSGLAVIVSVVLVVWLRRLSLRTHGLLCCALALILGGAIGNLIDRLYLGHVIDFVLVHWDGRKFPAFNVADAGISIGAVLVVIDALLEAQRERRARRGAPSVAEK